MARVLLGWEFGGGHGHVMPLLRLAQALAENGHEPFFAVKDLLDAAPVLADQPYPVLQAPLWPRRATAKPFRAASYSDVLAIRGFTDPDGLLAMVQAWQRLIDLVGPALVICDHSPTLCLTAYGALPTVVLGIPFAVPPIEQPTFPVLQEGVQPVIRHRRRWIRSCRGYRPSCTTAGC